MKAALLLLLHSLVLAHADTLGSFDISVDGHPTRLFAVSEAWQARFFDAPEPTLVTLTGGGRFYLASKRMPTPGNFVKDSYWQAPLLGRQLSYTVDLSSVGCSCNAALYFVSMPGHNASGNPDPTAGGDYYCGGARTPAPDRCRSLTAECDCSRAANAGKRAGNNYCPEMV
jgi:hypothetical protein